MGTLSNAVGRWNNLRGIVAGLLARWWLRQAKTDEQQTPAPVARAPTEDELPTFEAEEQSETAPVAPVVRAAPAVKAGIAPGVFYFRETILDKLNDYFIYLDRMKRGDRDAYNLYSRIGASIMPYNVHSRGMLTENGNALNPYFCSVMPSFGAVATGVSPEIEQYELDKKLLHPRFIYFTKFRRPSSDVELSNVGSIYGVTCYWDKLDRRHWKHPDKYKHGSPTEFAVCVTKDGAVRLLRNRLSSAQVIVHRHGKGRGSTSVIHHQRWGVPEFFIDWAREHKLDPQQHLRSIFVGAANEWMESHASTIRVSASKNGLTAVFGVDVLRTPYFFKDRDTLLTASGRKVPIFHQVRVQQRTSPSGRKFAVRTHFRGASRFRWNGYDMHISVPGKHHGHLIDIDVLSDDSEWHKPGSREMVGTDYLGRALAAHIDQGYGHALVEPTEQELAYVDRPFLLPYTPEGDEIAGYSDDDHAASGSA
jgi:hypothetical protein